MKNKIMFGISAFVFMFCFAMLLGILYLTGVGFYNGIHAFVMVALSVIATALTGIATLLFEMKAK